MNHKLFFIFISFVNEKPAEQILPTIGLQYYVVSYQLTDGSVINMHISDTCGQERFNSICERYYKKADGVLLVFDISNHKTFDKIKNYYSKMIRENCKEGIPIILLANKTDLKDQRQVTEEEAINLSINEEYVYRETSCVKNENVADAFETLIEMWNEEKTRRKESEKKTNQPLENRKRSGTVYFKPDQIDPKKSEMENIKKSYSYVYVDEDDSIAIKLNRHGIKSKEKKKCC